MASESVTIQEIPLAAETAQENSPENIVETPETQEIIPEPAAKKRGRPPGSRNRPKAAPEPAPKPKARAKEKRRVVHVEESSSEEEEPQPRSRGGVVALDRSTLAAEVLNLLQAQHVDRAAARRARYASWFQ